MKNKKILNLALGLVLLLVVTVLLSSGGSNIASSSLAVIGGEEALQHVPPQALDNANPQAAFVRVGLTPNSAKAKQKLRSLGLDVRHSFPNGTFTAHVPLSALPQLKSLAVVEEVPVHQLSAKPVCGNGVAEGGEKCGEPGLFCSEGQTCDNCKCKTSDGGGDPGGERLCTPSVQTEYNVVQVNGGGALDGEGVNVAVLDTGAFKNHLDLVDNITLCKDATKRGIRNGCADKNSVAHGTHTAGVVGASGGADGLGLFGAAPAVNLMIYKVCGGGGCFTDDIAAAIDDAAARGADIVNMSFSGDVESSFIRNAIDRNPGLLYVASSGNDGPATGSMDFPAANPKVVGVAANDSGKVVASFSSRGIDDGNDSVISTLEVELSAGGVAVESTHKDGCYSKLSGTSFSSPTVAGLAAKVWQGSASSTRAHMVSIAQDITSANGGGAGVGYDVASGHGLPVAP